MTASFNFTCATEQEFSPSRGCKIFFTCSGGVTHWALAPADDGGVMTIAWGQNAANG